MKKTATAPSNIAFIKYWGKKDEKLKLPENGSISMCLSNLMTHTTVDFDTSYNKDEVIINNKKEELISNKAVKHLDRIRKLANIYTKAKVVTNNSFPTGTGLSSSASGFAALSLAASSAAGLSLSEKQLSILARQGSGSACRSIPDGFVEWIDGNTSETSYAYSIYPINYWDIVDIVAIVSAGKKNVSSSEGQKIVGTSIFFPVRIKHIKHKIKLCKEYITQKDFTRFGELIESEALEMHAIMLTSSPSLIYWTPGTLEIIKLIKKWRLEGLECYFTINTGQDIHIIAQSASADKLTKKLHEVELVKDVIINKPAKGTCLVNDHLF